MLLLTARDMPRYHKIISTCVLHTDSVILHGDQSNSDVTCLYGLIYEHKYFITKICFGKLTSCNI